MYIISADARVCHGAGCCTTCHCTEGILLTQRAPKDGCSLDFDFGYKGLCPVATVEQDTAIGIVGILLFQSTNAPGKLEASCKAYIETTPVISVSQADGIS